GNAKPLTSLALDHVDRASQFQITDDGNGVVDTSRIRRPWTTVTQTKRQLELVGYPAIIVVRHAAQPFPQISSDAVDAVLPNSRDCRRQSVFVFRCQTL